MKAANVFGWRTEIPVIAGCDTCVGWGTLLELSDDDNSLRTRTITCHVCNGTGLVEIPRTELEAE